MPIETIKPFLLKKRLRFNSESHITVIHHLSLVFFESERIPQFFFISLDIEIFKEYKPIELFQNMGGLCIMFHNLCVPNCFLMNNHTVISNRVTESINLISFVCSVFRLYSLHKGREVWRVEVTTESRYQLAYLTDPSNQSLMI